MEDTVCPLWRRASARGPRLGVELSGYSGRQGGRFKSQCGLRQRDVWVESRKAARRERFWQRRPPSGGQTFRKTPWVPAAGPHYRRDLFRNNTVSSGWWAGITHSAIPGALMRPSTPCQEGRQADRVSISTTAAASHRLPSNPSI